MLTKSSLKKKVAFLAYSNKSPSINHFFLKVYLTFRTMLLARMFPSPLTPCHSVEGAASPVGNFAAPHLPRRTCASQPHAPPQANAARSHPGKPVSHRREFYSQLLWVSQPRRSCPSPLPITLPSSILGLPGSYNIGIFPALRHLQEAELLVSSHSSPTSFLY